MASEDKITQVGNDKHPVSARQQAADMMNKTFGKGKKEKSPWQKSKRK